jgi:hypothetical protein
VSSPADRRASGSEQLADEGAGGGCPQIATADGTAYEAALPVDEVHRRWAPHAVDATGDVAAAVEQDGSGVAALRHDPTDQVGRLAEGNEQDLEPLVTKLAVQRVDGR